MRCHRTRKGGFSLVELIVALAIASLIAGALGTFALAWQGRTFSSYKEAELHNDFRYALNVIAYYIREAKTITAGYSSDYILEAPGGTRTKFGHQSNRQTLWIKDSSLPLCSYVQEFVVDVSGLPLITLKLTSVSKLPGIKSRLPVTITRQIRMRNYGR